MITIDEMKGIMPVTLKPSVSQALVDKVNDICLDQEFAESYRENLIGYSHVIKEGKYTVEQYVDAVRYVSYKVMGLTNKDAYAKTFQGRYAGLLASGKDEKTISSYVAGYSKGKLVMRLMDQSMISFYVYNQDSRQKALDQLLHLMVGAKSEKVQADAAAAVLTHLKPPEDMPTINVAEVSGVLTDLYRASASLAQAQLEALQGGAVNARQVAESRIIDAEVVDE